MLKLYNISADGGKTWTQQWLTIKDVWDHKRLGHIVIRGGLDRC